VVTMQVPSRQPAERFTPGRRLLWHLADPSVALKRSGRLAD